MSWVFVNNTNVPVNVGISNAGILYHIQNEIQPFSEKTCKPLPPGEVEADDFPGLTLKDKQGRTLVPDTCAWDVDVAAIGWDFAVLYSTPQTELHYSDNWSRIVAIVGIAVGAIVAAAGVALMWVPGAGAALTIGGVTLLSAEVTAVTATAVAVGGGAVALLGIAADVAQVLTTPAKFIGWYGGHDYTIVINGGFEYDLHDNPKPPPDKAVLVTGVKPITVTWYNADSGASGTATSNF